jgi:acetylglutamate kinase
MNKECIHILKIGGEIVDHKDKLDQFLDSFSKLSGAKILVHGGGILLTKLAQDMSIPVKLIDGRRITDDKTLDLALMVYSGLINTKITATLLAHHCPAIGLNGADAGIILAEKRPVASIDYGLVGDITAINSDFLLSQTSAGIVPVLCALSCDSGGQMLNTNADTVAAETAIAISNQAEVHLSFIFDQPGVLLNLDDPESVVQKLDETQCKNMIQSGDISGGMLPKLHNGFYALEKGIQSVNICSYQNLSPCAGTILT